MNTKHFERLTEGANSRRDYIKIRNSGRTPENAINETLSAFENLKFLGRRGDVDQQTKDWFLAEIAAIRALLPIAKF